MKQKPYPDLTKEATGTAGSLGNVASPGNNHARPTDIINAVEQKKSLSFFPQQSIFQAGEPSDALYHIVEGQVKVSVLSQVGKEAVISLLGPGHFFGEDCLHGHSVRWASATAMTHVRAWRMRGSDVLAATRDNTELSHALLFYMLEQNARYQAELASHIVNSSEERLARTLILLARMGGEESDSAWMPAVSHQTLADIVGTTRARVTFFMNRFRRLGYVRYDRHQICVSRGLANVLAKR